MPVGGSSRLLGGYCYFLVASMWVLLLLGDLLGVFGWLLFIVGGF